MYYADECDNTDYEPEQIYLDDACPLTPYQRLRVSRAPSNPVYPRPELKAIDSFLNITLTTSVVAVIFLNSIVRGTGNNNRTGNQVTIRGVFWNIIPYLPARYDTPPAQPAMRIQLIWDKQPNGALPTGADLYVSGSFSYYPLNYNNKDRFVILRTWVYPSPLNGTTNYELGSLPIDMVSTYSNDTGVGAPITGALLLAYSVNNVNPTPNPTIYGSIRTYFYDS